MALYLAIICGAVAEKRRTGDNEDTGIDNEDNGIDNEDTGIDNEDTGDYRAITGFSEDTGEYRRPNRKVQALARKHNKTIIKYQVPCAYDNGKSVR